MVTRLKKTAARPAAVTRADAQAAEETFFERLGAALNGAMGVYNPLDNRTYDASGQNRVVKVIDERSAEVKALIKRHLDRNLMKVYEEMPRNAIHLAEIHHKELLGTKTPRVVVAGAAFSPVEDLVRRGESQERASAEDLARVRDRLVENPKVFTYLAAFSPTGWEPGARSLLAGPNFLVALCDRVHGAWRTHFAPDDRWRGGARLFDLSSEAEKVDAIRHFVKRHTAALLMDELTEDLVFEELGYPLTVIRSAFDELSDEDPFLRFDTAVRPFRLIRHYG